MPYLGEMQETVPATVSPIRCLEVFVFAPFLAYLALKSEAPTRTESRILMGAAAIFATCNGIKYLQNVRWQA